MTTTQKKIGAALVILAFVTIIAPTTSSTGHGPDGADDCAIIGGLTKINPGTVSAREPDSGFTVDPDDPYEFLQWQWTASLPVTITVTGRSCGSTSLGWSCSSENGSETGFAGFCNIDRNPSARSFRVGITYAGLGIEDNINPPDGVQANPTAAFLILAEI